MSLGAVLSDVVGRVGMDGIGSVRMGSVTLGGLCANHVLFLPVWPS